MVIWALLFQSSLQATHHSDPFCTQGSIVLTTSFNPRFRPPIIPTFKVASQCAAGICFNPRFRPPIIPTGSSVLLATNSCCFNPRFRPPIIPTQASSQSNFTLKCFNPRFRPPIIPTILLVIVVAIIASFQSSLQATHHSDIWLVKLKL